MPPGPPLPPPGHHGPYRPPRKGGGAAAGAAFGVLLIFGVVGTLVVIATLATGHDASKSAYDPPSYTYAPTTTSSYTTSRAPLTPANPAPETAATSRTTSPTGTTPAGPTPVVATGDNPLFASPDSGLPNNACGYPEWGTSVAAAQAFFDAAKTCLDNMWQPVLQAAGLPFSSPRVSVPATADETDSPCTSGSSTVAAAFYCGTNQTIYMPLDTIQIEQFGDDTVVYLGLFGHEYGHHIQSTSGVTSKERKERSAAGSNSEGGLEVNRRFELQAGCFGGMYIGSSNAAGTISPEQGGRVIDSNYRRGDRPGDVRDHGSDEHVGAWFEQGYTDNRTQQCNTWTAPTGEVS